VSALRILAAYRLLYCALIVVASVQTLIDLPGHHVTLLAAVEIAAALLLMWHRTQWPGAAVLLAVFAGAQAIAASEGQYPTRFLQYAASALLIVGLHRALAEPPRPD
jgi:hypothetical protein